MSEYKAVISCVPLVNFGGYLPKGLLVRRCSAPNCKREVAVSPESLEMELRLVCAPCAAKIVQINTDSGHAPMLRRLPSSEDPNSTVHRAMAAGEMGQGDGLFEKVPVMTQDELSRLNAKRN